MANTVTEKVHYLRLVAKGIPRKTASEMSGFYPKTTVRTALDFVLVALIVLALLSTPVTPSPSTQREAPIDFQHLIYQIDRDARQNEAMLIHALNGHPISIEGEAFRCCRVTTSGNCKS